MKLITTFALSFLVGSASSFAPVTTSTTTHNNHRVSPLNAVSQSELKGYYVYDADKDISDNIPSDWGFDPLGFSDTKGGMFFMREAEIKHARLAMLAAAGWPIAELFDRPLANLFHADVVVDAAGRSPSVLNGGLDKVNPLFWVTILAAASVIDVYQINRANENQEDYFPGNLGFDPLGLFPQTKEGQLRMQMKEIRNGRLAMIAITAFAAQEYVSNLGVVDETPAFFKPFFGMF